jgi:hypothetical protein
MRRHLMISAAVLTLACGLIGLSPAPASAVGVGTARLVAGAAENNLVEVAHRRRHKVRRAHRIRRGHGIRYVRRHDGGWPWWPILGVPFFYPYYDYCWVVWRGHLVNRCW